MNAARERTAEPAAGVAVGEVDAAYLESLIGYNARRAALAMIGAFLPGMAAFDLRPVDFSVLSLVLHNPGITSRQLCATLGILPPNLVGLVGTLERRGLVLRQPHPTDRRAVGLHLTAHGRTLMRKAERTAAGIEAAVASRLSPAEARTLIRLLRKVYLDR
jgi:DNA-binding MarR family transcriptional regulator